MSVSATDAATLFAGLTLYELDELIMHLTAAYRALVISGPLFDPFRAETRDLLADAHLAWLAVYARTSSLDSVPQPRHEPRPAPRPPRHRRVGGIGGEHRDGEAELSS